jgi:aminopeptidase
MIDVDFDSVAETLVRECMRVKAGETILVSGGVYCFELMEDIAVHIARQRAYFLIQPYTDQMQKRLFLETDIDYLQKTSKPYYEIVNLVDGRIAIDHLKDPRVLQGVPEERIGAQRQASMLLSDRLRERKVRWTGMGFPTREKADMYGVGYGEFHDMFWKAVNTDYQQMYAQGKRVAERLKNAHVRITSEKTDLEFSLEGRSILIDDGVISEEDVRIGDVGNNLPAGEVFCAPVESSCEGRAYFDAAFYKGEKITGIDAVFEKGKMVDVHCEKNEDVFKDVLANAHGGKDIIGEFGIGLNPEVKKVIGYVLTDEKIIGSIHIALGENRGFGGENESSLHWDLVMMHPTVEVGNSVIMEEGKLLV